MKTALPVAALATLLTVAAVPAFGANPVPCEKMLEDVRTALRSANLSDADRSKVAELESKGIERCNADDDAHSDEFFTQALKIMGK